MDYFANPCSNDTEMIGVVVDDTGATKTAISSEENQKRASMTYKQALFWKKAHEIGANTPDIEERLAQAMIKLNQAHAAGAEQAHTADLSARELFNIIDAEHSGVISAAEFQALHHVVKHETEMMVAKKHELEQEVIESEKQRKNSKNIIIALIAVVLAMAAAQLGVVVAGNTITQTTKTEKNVLVTTNGEHPVQTANSDFYVNEDGVMTLRDAPSRRLSDFRADVLAGHRVLSEVRIITPVVAGAPRRSMPRGNCRAALFF